MNLQTTLTIIGIVLFIVSIVRGCGGMMPGGCGMGSRRTNQRRPSDKHENMGDKASS